MRRKDKQDTWRKIGMLAAVVFSAYAAIRAYPDARRYLRIERM